MSDLNVVSDSDTRHSPSGSVFLTSYDDNQWCGDTNIPSGVVSRDYVDEYRDRCCATSCSARWNQSGLSSFEGFMGLRASISNSFPEFGYSVIFDLRPCRRKIFWNKHPSACRVLMRFHCCRVGLILHQKLLASKTIKGTVAYPAARKLKVGCICSGSSCIRYLSAEASLPIFSGGTGK